MQPDPCLDLAVGAPYEGAGAVYIFHGSDKGLKREFSQRIAASSFPSSAPRSGLNFIKKWLANYDGWRYVIILTW